MSTHRTISSFSILIGAVTLMLLGFALLPKLTIKYLPTLTAPSLSVTATWPQASPTIMEQEVTGPLEATLALVSGIDKIRSITREGQTRINLDIESNTSLDLLRFEIATRLRQIYHSLPDGCSYPTIALSTGEEEQEDQPVLVYSFAGKQSMSELYQFARDEVVPQLALTDGIQKIDILGANHNEWIINLNENSLRTYKISPAQIVRSLREQLATQDLGNMEWRDQRYPVMVKSLTVERAQQLDEIPVGQIKNTSIQLKDVSEITVKESVPQSYYRINGKNSLRLLMYPTATANTLVVANQMKRKVNDLQSTMGIQHTFYLDQDQSEFLEVELGKIKNRTILSLAILLLFIIIIYRGYQYLLVLLCSLIINLGLAFIAYYFLKVELNLYALAGITVTFGMIMDNSIVMMHHLLKQGNRKVFPALMASTLTTISALLVIFFLPDLWKLRLEEFAKVIMINLSISLVVAWYVVPALMDQFQFRRTLSSTPGTGLKSRKWIHFYRIYQNVLTRIIRWRLVAMITLILAFGIPVFLLPNQIKGQEWYNRTMGSEWYIEHVKPVVNRVLGGTLRLFTWYVYEGSGYRSEEETRLYARARMAEGATIEQMNATIQQVEQYLIQFPQEIKQFIATVRSGQSAEVIILFNPEHDLSFPYVLKSRLQVFCSNMGGIAWSIYGVGQAFSNSGGSSPPRFRVAMKGYNKEILLEQAMIFADSLLVHPRIQEVNTEANLDYWQRDRHY